MAQLCFSCRKRAWNSAADGPEPQESLVLLQEPRGPWALPFYPRLGDPFQHSPEFVDSLHHFCGLSRRNCSGCGHLFKESCEPCAEHPESQPTAWTPMDPKAAKEEADPAEDMSPGTIREPDALGASQETEAGVSGNPHAPPAEAEFPQGLPL